MTERSFPPGFLWGAAHAGHQVEGNNDNSDTWFAENVTPTVFKEPSGRAVNNYELWAEDIDLAKGLGLNAYRFSVEWARVEPAAPHCEPVGGREAVSYTHLTLPTKA